MKSGNSRRTDAAGVRRPGSSERNKSTPKKNSKKSMILLLMSLKIPRSPQEPKKFNFLNSQKHFGKTARLCLSILQPEPRRRRWDSPFGMHQSCSRPHHLKQCRITSRIRIGIHYRLLRQAPGVNLQILDIVPRENLKTWIRQHS